MSSWIWLNLYRINIIEDSIIGEKKLLENYENMEDNSENDVEEATPETGVKHEEGIIDEEKSFNKD